MLTPVAAKIGGRARLTRCGRPTSCGESSVRIHEPYELTLSGEHSQLAHTSRFTRDDEVFEHNPKVSIGMMWGGINPRF